MTSTTKAVLAAVGLALVAGGAAVARAVVPLWQGGAAWGSRKLGFGESTIGKAGCLLTLFTMASNSLLGTSYTPDVVNEMLKRAQAFTGSNIFPDRAAAALGLVLGERVYSAADARRVVDAALERGGLAVVHVDHNGDGKGDHFILVNGRGAGGYTAADPAPAKIVQLSSSLAGVVKWGSVSKNYVPVGAFALLTKKGTANA